MGGGAVCPQAAAAVQTPLAVEAVVYEEGHRHTELYSKLAGGFTSAPGFRCVEQSCALLSVHVKTLINTLGSTHPWESQTSMPGQMGMKGMAFKACEHGSGRHWAPQPHLCCRGSQQQEDKKV